VSWICRPCGALHAGCPLATIVLTAVAMNAVAPGLARAAASPHWTIVAESQPTRFEAGRPAGYLLLARNDGGAPTARGSAVELTDTLPAGVTATAASGEAESANGNQMFGGPLVCTTPPITGTVSCRYEESATEGRLQAGTTLVVKISLSLPASFPEGMSLQNSATVSGGGAPSASVSEATPIEPDAVAFGISLFDVNATDEAGEAQGQAASHPFELAATLAFNVAGREAGGEGPTAPAAPKDVEVALPAGLVGNPTAVPRCSQRAFLEGASDDCPYDTQVGTIQTFLYGPSTSNVYPVYDIVPPPGQPAELGFTINGIGHVPLLFALRSGGDYGLTAQLRDISEIGPLQGAILALWGEPAATSHDLERESNGEGGGGFCQPSVKVHEGVESTTGCPSGVPVKPFLTLPSRCQSSPLTTSVAYDSWEQPQITLEQLSGEPIAGSITGCEKLSFVPTLALAPETAAAGVPSGYTLDVHVPQDEDPNGLSTPDLHSAAVSVPAGVTLSPSAANGLQACSAAQFQVRSTMLAACPGASRLGMVRVSTPLLEAPLEGELFLGEPRCSPCSPSDTQEGRLLPLLLQAQGSGLTVKLEGSASIDQATGVLTARFADVPQLPIEDVALTLDGGANAPLENPSSCGVPLSGSAQLTPYSSETPAQATGAPFELSGCKPPWFRPTFVAGTTNNQAAAFSPLTVSLARGDEEESFKTLSVQLPPGVLGTIASVPLCPAPAAQAGTCPPQSLLGKATITAGPGPAPLPLEGSVYLTGPHGGAPFGLSIVVPAQAGPLNLGTIVVGASVAVDPRTAALTITSDPLPQSLDGIPLQIKTIALDVDRAGFIRNPTDCDALAVKGTLTSGTGAVAAVTSRFQAANCARLAFEPKLSALTHNHTDKAAGVHLHVRIAATAGQANIAAVTLNLPRQMVPRMSALQRACMAATFEADPASCPAASAVGSATVRSPLLRAPLAGPVYVLSRGAAASPEIALVLQGEGVLVEVIGQTRIRNGFATSVFSSLPDVPVSQLDLTLDAGPGSLLAANLTRGNRASMCGRRLSMPTTIAGQNGAVVKQATIVSVSGCAKQHGKRKRRHASRARLAPGA
jgi:hypothetical protein